MLMLKPEKVATPATAGTLVEPDSAPPPGLFWIATTTAPVKPDAVLPRASRAVSWTAGVMLPPAGVVLGCTVKASCVAGPAVTLIVSV